MKERILVVGGTGFIGSNLVRYCVQRGFSCSVLSLNAPEVGRRIVDVDYIPADLTNLEQLRSRLGQDAEFEYVVNLSGYIDHSSFFSGGRRAINVHFGGVQNLIETLNRTSLKCFVQVGSSDEYGNIPAPQRESSREAPISPYSLAKMASTQFMQMLNRTEGFPSVVVRLFLVYGEGQEDKRFLPQIIKGCLADRKFSVSEGNQLRDFCHVEDISRGIVSVLTNKKALGEVINLASGKPVTIRSMIEKVQMQIGKGEAMFGKIPYRPSENMELFADIEKAVQLLDWEPLIDLDEGLLRTISYYQNKWLQEARPSQL